MSMKKKMRSYEEFVLGHFLSDYPTNKSYGAILKLIAKESDLVSIWEPFEHCHPEDVVQYMENMKDAAISSFMPREGQ